MFKSLLRSVGIGGARVDTVLLPDATGTTVVITADQRGAIFGGERRGQIRVSNARPDVGQLRHQLTNAIAQLS